MLDHPDPVIMGAIEDIEKKDIKRGNAFREKYLQSGIDTQDGKEIAERISIINKWYEKWQEDAVWNKLKSEAPDLVNKLMESMDAIDSQYARFINKKCEWRDVEARIDKYAAAWGHIANAYKA